MPAGGMKAPPQLYTPIRQRLTESMLRAEPEHLANQAQSRKRTPVDDLEEQDGSMGARKRGRPKIQKNDIVAERR
jgi:hypothetical protein